MAVSNSSTIISFAILKVNWEHQKDYLETFVPIVAECIRLSNNEIVTTPNLQEEIKSRFGLVIPQNSIKTILIRVKKRGYIRQENKVYYANFDRLTDVKASFYQIQQQVLKMYEDLIQHFLRFCNDKFNVKL